MKKTLSKLKLLIALSAMLTLFVSTAYAQTTGDLVNTESFFIIDDGDGTTDIELEFGDSLGEILKYDITNNRFEFTDDLYIQGNMDLEGENLNINTDGSASDSVIDFNSGSGSIQYNNATDDFTLSDTVNVTGDVDADGDMLLDADDTGGDVTIQFGATLAEIIEWDSTNNRFNISDDLNVDGGVTVNGDVDFNQNQAVEMVIDQGTSFPVAPAPVEGQIFYRTDLDTFYVYDGSSWIALADVSGANSIFLSPLYPHTSYYGDGSNNVGRLTYYFDAANIENAYRWETTRSTAQDYDIKVRIQLPDNFSSWDANPIEFKYRTDTTTAADNQLDFTMQDTADASVTMSNNTGLVSSVAGSWIESTNMTISGGTFNPGDWLTITLKVSADNSGGAEAGSIVLNYNTTN